MRPLVIQCGAGKVDADRPVPIWRLYTGPLWSTYRAARERQEGSPVDGPHPARRVFVLSAEFGLMPESVRRRPYDRVLVDDGFRAADKAGTPVRRVSELLPTVRAQVEARSLDHVVFAGSALYASLLRSAGLEVEELAPGGGIGDKRQALRLELEQQRPAIDLTALLLDIERSGR